MNGRALLLVAAALAAPALAFAIEAGARQAAEAVVDEGRVGATIDALCAPEMMGRRDGSAGGEKAVAFLAKAFAEAGLERLEGQSSYVVKTPSGEENVLGRVAGSDRASEAIVLSAHWDGIGQDEQGHLVPGADENGSGIAALLEAARALAKTKPRRTLVFACFGGWWDQDDAKRFRGAKEFLKGPQKAKPVFQVELMTLGAPLLPKEPERFFALGSESSAAVTKVLAEAAAASSALKIARASADLVEKRGPRDDYDAFRAAGVPFVFLTSGVSRNYHKPSDVPATVDRKRVAAAARFAIELAGRVDALDAAPEFASEPLRDDRADATEVLGLIEAALAPGSGIVLTTSERRALTFKRDKIKDLLEDPGELHLAPRERGILKDSLELLLLALTK